LYSASGRGPRTKLGPADSINTNTSSHFPAAARRGSVKSPGLVGPGDTRKRLVAACNRIARSRLPRVFKKTQVKSTDFAVLSRRIGQTGSWNLVDPSVESSGRCDSAQNTPTIRLATRAL
jgi:hypothetical protein